jgi:hypothetical protein
MVLRVAPDALEGSVLSFQHVPGLIVVEFFLVETDKREPPAVMFVVAFHTLLPRQLRMKPLPRRHARTELRMTREALVIRDLFPEGMALRAIPHPFEGGVRSGQVAGRDLRSCRRTQRQEESGEHAGGRYGMPQNIHV